MIERITEAAVEALADETGTTAGDVHDLADEIGVDAGREVVEVQIDVVDTRTQLGGEVITQVLGIEMLEVGARLDEGATRLRHLGAVDREETVCVDTARFAETRTMQHRRPEQRMEIDDVLANEMVQLGGRVGVPERVEINTGLVTKIAEAGHVADRRIQPDIEVLARRVGNLEAEVGCVTRDVPVVEPGLEPFVELVGDLGLNMTGGVPVLEHLLEITELEEQVLRVLLHRGRAGHRRHRVDQVGRRVGGAAHLAVVAVLVECAALGTNALDEAIGQEHLRLGIVGLRDRAARDMTGVAVALVDGRGADAVLFRVRRMIVVEADGKAGEIFGVLLPHACNERLGLDTLGARAQHDRGDMGVDGAHVIAFVPAHLLEAAPDIGLDVFDQVTQVDRAVGIGQGAGDQDLAGVRHGVCGSGCCVVAANYVM